MAIDQFTERLAKIRTRFAANLDRKIDTLDHALPRFHRLAPNVVTFCGYNGRGIGTGTVFGRLLADHVLGKLSEKDLPLPVTDPEAPAFPSFREAYYEAGAQVAHAVGARL